MATDKLPTEAGYTISDCIAAFTRVGKFHGNPEIEIQRYLSEALDGKPIELIVTTCPDYPYKKVLDAGTIFTFDGLNDGSGLVADGVTTSLVPLIAQFEASGVYNRLNFCYADTEAYDPDLLKTSHLTVDEFMVRVGQSALRQFYLLHQHYLSENLSHFSVPEISVMSQLGLENSIDLATSLFANVRRQQIDGVKVARKSLYEQMFEAVNDSRVYSDFDNFCTERAKKDIKDHIIFGEAIRVLAAGIRDLPSTRRNIIIVTMSNPILSRYFNCSMQNPRIPVLMLQKNYG